MKRYPQLLILSLLLLSNLNAATIELEEVTVEAANRTTQNLRDTTESISIITAEDIKESRVTNLNDALNQLGNLTMGTKSGPGQTSSFLVRGMDSRNTLVLIDGMRYNDPTGLSGAQYSHIVLSDIERIEIVKGAQSGIWGADASAGVINIVTKGAQEGLHLQANAEAGSFDSKLGSLQASYKTDIFDIILGISRSVTDGYSTAEPNQGTVEYGNRGDDLGYEDDGYTNNTYNVKLGLSITDKDRVQASFRRISTYTEFDGSTYNLTSNAYESVDAQNYESGFYGITPYFEKIDNRFYSAQYSHKEHDNDLSLQYNYSSFKRLVSGYEGNIQEVSLQDRINYLEESFLRIGGSYQRFEHEENYGESFDKDYNDKAIFLTNYNKVLFFDMLGETVFTQSLRFDDYSAFENKTTGKLGLKQFVYDDIYLSSNYGTAYNVPSLYQLYAPGFPDFFNPGAIIPVGNESLSPEDTKTFDITLGNDELTLTYFYNKINNMIEYDFVLGYQNVPGTSRIKGLELGYKDDFFDVLTLNLNYTYLDAKNADRQRLPSRPKHQIDGNIFYYITEDLNIGLNGQYIGERYDNEDEKGAQTGCYTVFNAVLNYTFSQNVSFYVKADNLGDKYYQLRDGYATSQRAYYAGLTAKF